MTQPRAFLGVEQSVSGRRWVGPTDAQERLAELTAQRVALPRPVCQTLARMGVDPETAEQYLAPSLRDLMSDPSQLNDMDAAVTRLVDAVNAKQKIAIFADYDVDGGASAALLLIWLRELGMAATLYIPDRVDEGYGPSEPAMAQLASRHDLIICVDCGTLSHDPIAAAHGADVIILDHHLGGEHLPEAVAVVNPNRQDETGDLGHLCAAGVVFLLLVAANRARRLAGQDFPDLMSLLDLVALATVADVAPLVGLNRAFVRQGLKVMAQRQRVGLVALGDIAQLQSAPTAYHLGFVFGPRLNAGGRIGAPDLGARLMTTQDPAEAQALAERLEGLNSDRRDIEAAVREAALSQAETRGMEAPLTWAAGEGWHPGVVGIVAARLKDATNRPSVVIGLDGEVGKGSGRSVAGIDIGAQIQRLAKEGLLIKGGGHKMAAGLTVARDKLEDAMARLSEMMAAQGAGQLGPKDLVVDGVVSTHGLNVDIIEQLEAAGPFGAGAPAPRFVFADQSIRFCKPVGGNHLKFSFGEPGGATLDAIAFGAFSGPIGPKLQNHAGHRFHLAGRVEINSWGGRQSVQLRLEDVAQV